MEPANQPFVRRLLERVKKEVPHADVWVYSGYTFEELVNRFYKRAHTEDTMPLLNCVDILVDGEFHIAERNISLRFRGSSNQRIIDVQKTLKAYEDGLEKIILSEYM